MILQKLQNGLLIVKEIKNISEDEFLLLNKDLGYYQIDENLFPSKYNKYTFENTKIVVDTKANDILFKKEILVKLDTQIKTHSSKVKKFILGDKFCKLDIYEHKEVKANEKNVKTSEDKTILKKAKQFHTSEDWFLKLIEAYTDIILDFIKNNELDKAEMCLNIVSEYDDKTTLKDINKLKTIESIR